MATAIEKQNTASLDRLWKDAINKMLLRDDSEKNNSVLCYDKNLVRQLRTQNPSSIESSVINFVSWFACVEKEKVTPDTYLVQDLEIDGPDALEFIETFSSYYGVDVRSFPIEEYIHNENRRQRFSIYSLLTSGHPFRPHDLKDLRVSDLICAVKQKILFSK